MTMLNDTVTEDAGRPVSTQLTSRIGHPMEQLEIEQSSAPEVEINYPTGPKVWLAVATLCVTMFLKGLDLTIVAVPSLTNQFKTVADIGWYNAAYGLALSASVFFFGKVYTIFSMRLVFIFGIVVFELGSLLCTLATSSKMFIGRAIAGLGSSAMGIGTIKMLRYLFPLSKQALWVGFISGSALIDAFSWRACFRINLPLGVFCMAFTVHGFHDPVPSLEITVPLWEKVKRTNPLGTLLIVPALTCFLMALQLGGSTYGWGSWRIVLMLILFGVLISAFKYLQYLQAEKATIPIKILKNRSTLAGLWYNACCDGILAVTESYISIYFQGVRGYTATKSGLLEVSMIVGLFIAIMLAAAGTTKIGYFFPPTASGLLTTINVDQSVAKASALLGFLGIAIGLGIQCPQLGVMASLPVEDISIGTAVISFGAGMGSAVFVSVSSTLFRNRLVDEVQKYSPSTNATAVEAMGLSEIRGSIGSDTLGAVLSGYNQAVIQTLYIPLGLGLLTIIGTVAMERRSMKDKQS
ncbi:major facilitator superfamily domain-containing protein [Xylogone sp. PMI_703]|nr:major facilitator superfamily domain-containing protein [Xylogone sp. PMI_703]